MFQDYKDVTEMTFRKCWLSATVDRGENNDVNIGSLKKYEIPAVFGKNNKYILEVESDEAENSDFKTLDYFMEWLTGERHENLPAGIYLLKVNIVRRGYLSTPLFK